jgi:PAS domain S-box-containing protein
LADDDKLLALNALLMAAARHPNLLVEEAFDEIVARVADLVAFDRIGVLIPEGSEWLRVYAASWDGGGSTALGERVPSDPAVWPGLFVEQRPHTCDDMRLGNATEREVVSTGMLSYAAFPIRVVGPAPAAVRSRGGVEGTGGRPGDGARRVIALLVLSFAAAGAASRVPMDRAQEIADALGPSVERSVQIAREHRLSMILETSGDAMIAWDRRGLVTDVNAAAEVLSGRGRRELLGKPVAELLDPPPRRSEVGTATAGVRHALLARAPGGLARVVVAATVTAVEHDPVVAAHALLRDLTQVVHAEEEAALHLARIRELEEQHRTLLDNAPLIIFRLLPPVVGSPPTAGALVYLNRHAERLLGVPLAEALATPGFLRGVHADPEGVLAFDEAVARAGAGGTPLPYEARLERRGGEEITVRGTVYPLLSEGGLVVAIEGMLADVSAEHAARTRLVQADRLSTLGMLAAGVAHEINNPAAHILIGLDLHDRLLSGRGVAMEPAVAEAAHETIRELRESIRRIVDIARDLRLFASAPALGAGRRTIVDVNRTVESALSLTRGQILERAEIDPHLDEVPPVLMDDGRLGQVIVNLLVNAAQAIPRDHGSMEAPRPAVITVATRSDGVEVEIEVSDTGTGIPRENMARIWQPFFTTKGPAMGTGLGLSISREIVERAGGTIAVESPAPGTDPPSGARFTIRLPAAGADVPKERKSSPLPPDAPRARVLVVEDEPALARALAGEIGRFHDVTLAGSAEDALARTAAEPFSVILCDLRMPGMGGEGLYTRLLHERPDQAAAFVFMTGVGFGAEVERFLAASGRPVLEKPFPADVALTAIARVLKRRP